jgi:hypothetical protein
MTLRGHHAWRSGTGELWGPRTGRFSFWHSFTLGVYGKVRFGLLADYKLGRPQAAPKLRVGVARWTQRRGTNRTQLAPSYSLAQDVRNWIKI